MIFRSKRLFTFLIFFLGLVTTPLKLFAQHIALRDSFNDGDFTSNPTWYGTNKDFKITPDSSKMLQLSASTAGISYLSTKSQSAYGSWKFFIRMDFAPSGSNEAEIFLISDRKDLSQEVNGYAIQVGERGSDDVFHLLRYDNGAPSQPILSDTTNVSQGGNYTLLIKRKSNGKWSLAVSKGYESNPHSFAIGMDNVYKSSSYFGIQLHYTSSRSDKFYFDDFLVQQSVTKLIGYKLISRKEIQLQFTTPLDNVSISTGDFTINRHIGSPENIITNGNLLTLKYPNSLAGGSYSLTISHLKNQYDQSVPDTTVSFTLYDKPQKRDIVVNEIMYDPPSNVSEYVELYNASDKTFNLKNWQLDDASNAVRTITDNNLILHPNSYIVLTSDTTTLYRHFGSHSFYQMLDFPILNNSFDRIKLIDDSGQMIDSLEYHSSWGGNGKSLERRSAMVPSIYKENWGNSPAILGGTPGQPNKISKDTTPPVVKHLKIIDDRHFMLTFSKIIHSGEDPNSSFQFSPSLSIDSTIFSQSMVYLTLTEHLKHRTNYTLSISGIKDLFGNVIRDTTFHLFYNPDDFPPKALLAKFNSDYSKIMVSFNEPALITSKSKISLKESGVILKSVINKSPKILQVVLNYKLISTKSYKIRLQNIADTTGNILQDTTLTIAHPPNKRDVVINEIMYHPITNPRDHQPDQCEYVELYNRKSVAISLSGAFLHDAPDENGKITKIYPLNDAFITIPPHDYVVLYADTVHSFLSSRIYQSFKPQKDSTLFCRVDRTTMSLSSKSGTVYISNNSGQTIDSVYYSDTWQDPNIPDHHGISIERIDPDGPSNSAQNWGSSASPAGGTPGTANSIMIKPQVANTANTIKLSPNPFSPDHDGFQDNLSISYHFAKPDYMLRIRIFDRYGRIVRHLVNNKLAGSTGTIIWNGLSDNENRNKVGIYILLIQAYNSSSGPAETFKKEVVIARKF